MIKNNYYSVRFGGTYMTKEELSTAIIIISSITATISFIFYIILIFLQIIAIVRLFHRKWEDDIAIAVFYILGCVFGPIFSFGGSILATKS
ncbi:hypothetical protein U5U50_03180 [Mycoplasma sp. 888]|uniref:hypothetical protein n=1 Tax=Mycoplasma sp. 888 TaxID=3108483 RepID=UPI002D7892FC|nr:hypothetical protein [Mycoplasma sp. 888]WRQ25784.1 hypothetical protein U5U50_03180 [Mycoplasma sp. 888]